MKKFLILSSLLLANIAHSAIVINQVNRTTVDRIRVATEVELVDGFYNVISDDVTESSISSSEEGLFAPENINHVSYVSNSYINSSSYLRAYAPIGEVAPAIEGIDYHRQSFYMEVDFTVNSTQKYDFDYTVKNDGDGGNRSWYKLENITTGNTLIDIRNSSLSNKEKNDHFSGMLASGNYRLSIEDYGLGESFNAANFHTHYYMKFSDYSPIINPGPIIMSSSSALISEVPVPAAAWLFGSALIGLLLRNKR